MIDHTPGLPLSAAQALLDSANSLELKGIDQGAVPSRLSELAQALRDEAQINHAYDGLYLDAADNLDTHRLALHSLERLPGWSKKVRLELRSSDPDSTLIDAIGKPRAGIRRVLLRSDDGRYTAKDSKGPLSGETDWYTATLQALPDAERDALGLDIGQGPALKQALRTHALERKPLRTLISAQAAPEPTDTRTHLRLLGMDNYPPAPAPPAQPDSRALARELFPAHSDEHISHLLQDLDSRPAGAWPILIALREDYLQLDRDLATWEANTPRRYPGTEVTMSRQEYVDARQSRRIFRHELLRCWRQETEVDQYFEPPTRNGKKLTVLAPLSGELPALRLSFEPISYLQLRGDQSPLNVDGFLRSFPRLRYLSISKASLGQLPPGIATLPGLNTLILSECGITLTPQSLNALTAMNRLRTLDLFNNPLGFTPSVENMLDLKFLDLSFTGISEMPAGLLNRPSLALANLSNNQITQLPAALFDLPADTHKTIDLSANPLSRAALDQVKSYYQRTGLYWEVDAPAADIHRVKTLFPNFSENEVNRFIFGLPGNLDRGPIELTRLETEYTHLSNRLETWARQASTLQEQTGRQAFKQSLQACWRLEGPLDESSPQVIPTYTLENPEPFSGEFPTLDSAFSHVSSLRLRGAGDPLPLQSSLFFKGFPTLNQLSIEHYGLGDIPGSILDMPQLSSLRLPHCALTLSEAGATSLATLGNLQQLDLSYNPLGRLPDFSALPRLAYINLEQTSLTQIPDSLLTAIERKHVNLSNNQISQIPDGVFTLSATVTSAFDLSDNPLSRSTLMQIKRYYQRTGEHFQADAPAALRNRIKVLYPTFTDAEADHFFFTLPGDLDAAEPALDRLESEYEQLCTHLQQWVQDVPTRHPILDIPLDPQTRMQDHFNRLEFKTLLEEAWRRETELDDDHDTPGTTHKLAFDTPILGALPELSARFDHVSSLELEGNGSTTGADGLLRCFPKLRQLVITQYSLGDIPPTVLTLSELSILHLSGSAVRLTPNSVAGLSQMSSLVYLDLSENPLGLTPDVSQLSELESLYLQDTDITETPTGLFTLRKLRTLDLSDNRIADIPAGLLELPEPLDDASDLSGNPLSEQSLSHLRQYYYQTGNDLSVAQARRDTAGDHLLRPENPSAMEE